MRSVFLSFCLLSGIIISSSGNMNNPHEHGSSEDSFTKIASDTIFTIDKSQDLKNIVNSIFESRNAFILKEVPDTFIFYYIPFIELDTKLIVDTIKDILERENILAERNYYLIEFVPDDYRSKKYGVFWTKSVIITYKWDNLERKLEVIMGEYLDMSKPFIKDVEKWDEFVTNRSYRYTSIAGAWYVFCSRITTTKSKLKIENAVFREYSKDHFEYYLKEKPKKNFRATKVRNPEFKPR